MSIPVDKIPEKTAKTSSYLLIYTGPYQYDFPEILKIKSAEFPGEDHACGFIPDQDICPGKPLPPVCMLGRFSGKNYSGNPVFFLYSAKESVYYPL